MKNYILPLLLVAIAMSSCTTAYKAGQTPDDVYYSPARPQDEYVRVDKRDDRRYEADDNYYEDRYLRMRVRDRYRWSVLDDYYFNNTYAYNYYGFSNNWNNPWNNYYSWNSYYNPYYHGGYYGGHHGGYYGGGVRYPVSTVRPSRPVVFNANSYNTPSTQGTRVRAQGGNYNNYNNRYNNSNTTNRYNNNNSTRRGIDSYTQPSNNTPTRSYTPSSSNNNSSSGGRSSSGSSGSSGGSRPPR